MTGCFGRSFTTAGSGLHPGTSIADHRSVAAARSREMALQVGDGRLDLAFVAQPASIGDGGIRVSPWTSGISIPTSSM
jgi:hypothetical protein